MNDRIKELAQIAQKYIDDNKYEYDIVTYHYEFAFRDKFAELIIKECSELTLDYKNKDYYSGWLEYREEIIKHFGVNNDNA